jgi:uroporphyrinogen-III synthase
LGDLEPTRLSAASRFVWVTRTLPGARETGARIAALGHRPVIAPLMEVRANRARLDLAGVGAIVFTSRNGVAAFARQRAAPDLPVFAVGDRTAKAARHAGFQRVMSAAGDVEALTSLILARRDAFAGTLLHAGALEPAGDLPGALRRAGLTVTHAPIYRTCPVAPARLAAVASEAAACEAVVMLYSPKAAAALAALYARREAAPGAAVCISPAAQAALGGLPIGRLAVAKAPTEAAMLDALVTLVARAP